MLWILIRSQPLKLRSDLRLAVGPRGRGFGCWQRWRNSLVARLAKKEGRFCAINGGGGGPPFSHMWRTDSQAIDFLSNLIPREEKTEKADPDLRKTKLSATVIEILTETNYYSNKPQRKRDQNNPNKHGICRLGP